MTQDFQGSETKSEGQTLVDGDHIPLSTKERTQVVVFAALGLGLMACSWWAFSSLVGDTGSVWGAIQSGWSTATNGRGWSSRRALPAALAMIGIAGGMFSFPLFILNVARQALLGRRTTLIQKILKQLQGEKPNEATNQGFTIPSWVGYCVLFGVPLAFVVFTALRNN